MTLQTQEPCLIQSEWKLKSARNRHQPNGHRHIVQRQLLNVNPMTGQERSGCKEEHAENHCDGEVDGLERAQQVRLLLLRMGIGGKTGDTAIERRAEAKVEQPEHGLKRGVESDQPVRLDAEQAEKEGNANDAERCRPKTARKIREDVQLDAWDTHQVSDSDEMRAGTMRLMSRSIVSSYDSSRSLIRNRHPRSGGAVLSRRRQPYGHCDPLGSTGVARQGPRDCSDGLRRGQFVRSISVRPCSCSSG